MSIRSHTEIEKLRAIGRIVRLALGESAAAVRPGISTGELERIGARALALHGAEAAPPRTYGFPGGLCISVNDEAVHGIPGLRELREGDLVKLDLVAEKEGFYADAAVTVSVGAPGTTALALMRSAESDFQHAVGAATAGIRVCEIGWAVESETRRRGFRVIRELCGHGGGQAIHEPPNIPNYYDARHRTRLTEGLVITVEPIVAAGRGLGVLDADGWTIRTADVALSAQYEHTLVITKGAPILLTV